MLSFQLGILLVIVGEWLLGVLFFAFALGALYGARYLEVYFTSLKILAIGEKRSKWIQSLLSFLAMVIAVLVFIPFLMLLPDDNEYINFYTQFFNSVFSG